MLVSSHLMTEMENTADHLIVIGRGRLIADARVAVFVAQGAQARVVVRTPAVLALTAALGAVGASVQPASDGLLEVTGLTAAEIGDLALARGIAVHELSPRRASLEEAFMELTADSIDYLAGELS